MLWYWREDPTPLTHGQVRALARAVGRELTWGLGEVSREIDRWRALAVTIPDPRLRADALYALRKKRTHAEGAALFSVLPRGRNGDLVRLLVAYEVALDYLDEISERHPDEANGRELHLALIDALDPTRPLADYYRHHPWKDDGGYLDGLVEACRRWCRSLPSYPKVRALIQRETWRSQVLALNHLEPAGRDAALRRWAAREFPQERDLRWFELSAAASASLVVHSLLALASRADVAAADVAATYAVYWPWTSLATAMLDSYVDREEDDASGNHSYIAHYGTHDCAVRRLCESIGRAAQGTRLLDDGGSHAVIVASMVAMYLSKDSARLRVARPTTRRLMRSGGSLTRLLGPAVRAWRLAYSLRSA